MTFTQAFTVPRWERGFQELALQAATEASQRRLNLSCTGNPWVEQWVIQCGPVTRKVRPLLFFVTLSIVSIVTTIIDYCYDSHISIVINAKNVSICVNVI